MIDSPMSRESSFNPGSNAHNIDRGYEFDGAVRCMHMPTPQLDHNIDVSHDSGTLTPIKFLMPTHTLAHTRRWFAERADVILMFFDPDKPGNLDAPNPPKS